PGARDIVLFSKTGLLAGAYTDGADGTVHGWVGDGFYGSRIPDPPDAVYSYATAALRAVPSGYRAVGRFDTQDGITHGFLRTPAGAYETIDVPDALATIANGINENGTIVGEFTDLDGVTHGFVLEGNAVFRTVDFPDATATVIRAIERRSDDLSG